MCSLLQYAHLLEGTPVNLVAMCMRQHDAWRHADRTLHGMHNALVRWPAHQNMPVHPLALASNVNWILASGAKTSSEAVAPEDA